MGDMVIIRIMQPLKMSVSDREGMYVGFSHKLLIVGAGGII